MSVADAVQRDIDGMGTAATGPLAATALALATELDEPGNSATSKSMCAKALIDVLRELRSVAPPKEAPDGVTDINEKRAKRLARLAASAGSSSS